MTPGITAVRMTGARHRDELPLLVLGPSLGTSAEHPVDASARAASPTPSTWSPGTCPGTATTARCPTSRSRWPSSPRACSRSSTTCCSERGQDGGPFFYAGDSVGGAVGLQLLLDRPDRVTAAALLCTGAKIGDEAMWTGRIGQVSVSGTPVMVTGSAERWFGPGFLDRGPRSARRCCTRCSEADDDRLLAGVRRPRRLRRTRPARRDRRTRPRGRRQPRRRHAAGPAARDRRRRAGRPVRRARRRRPPRTRRGAGGGGRAAPPALPRRGARARRRPHHRRGPRRRDGRTARGARRRARRPRDRGHHRLHP